MCYECLRSVQEIPAVTHLEFDKDDWMQAYRANSSAVLSCSTPITSAGG